VRRSRQQRHHPVLASIAIRPFFLIGELLLRKLSKTVVVVGNAPHDRPGFLMCHLVGNRASFLCTRLLTESATAWIPGDKLAPKARITSGGRFHPESCRIDPVANSPMRLAE
jgi:hypothetical protein